MLATRRLYFFFFFIALAGAASAQTNANSPYSRFGLGLMNQPGFVRNRAMGGVGIALRDNRYINYLNPASCSAIDTMSFLFDFGIMGHYTYTETSSSSDDFYGMNMDHLAIAFPITKWWAASFSVLPYSKVGYSISEQDFAKDIGFIEYLYTGNGGINQLNLGTSLKFLDHFSLGANFKYLFGSIDLSRRVSFSPSLSRSYSKVVSRTIVSDFIYDLGVQYSQDFLENFNLTLGMVFDNRARVSAENRILKQNIFPGSTVGLTDSTTLDPSFVLEESSVKGNIVIPAKVGAGLTLTYADKIRLAFDYYNQDWSKSTFFNSDQPLARSNGYYGGLEIIPDPTALKGYHKHIAYRLGGHYKNSYLQLQGEQLKDYGIGFGVGLPLRNTKSTFNLACELGRRGTLENNLIRENYMIISFSVTLHDFWFMKRKFD